MPIVCILLFFDSMYIQLTTTYKSPKERLYISQLAMTPQSHVWFNSFVTQHSRVFGLHTNGSKCLKMRRITVLKSRDWDLGKTGKFMRRSLNGWSFVKKSFFYNWYHQILALFMINCVPIIFWSMLIAKFLPLF